MKIYADTSFLLSWNVTKLQMAQPGQLNTSPQDYTIHI